MIDLVIIGGGPAGLSVAVTAYKNGVKNLLIIERGESLGGILNQCIHSGFGLHKMGEELTGPEYAERYASLVKSLNIPYKLNTTVLSVSSDKKIVYSNESDGIVEIEAKSVVFAMGCRERSRGALNVPGDRPAGVFTSGTAQKLINIDGYMPGKKVVILGSGDIGLIMARRMTLEGAKVLGVYELMPYSSGLARNIEQCLNDFNIPLKLSHTVVKIHGEDRLTGVTVAKVDGNRKVVAGSEEFIECDTLLLSVGLIPENELTTLAGVKMDKVTGGAIVNQDRKTSINGIYACGNVLHVHDLVDYVSSEGEIVGLAVSKYLQGKDSENLNINVETDGKIRYTVPQIITKSEDVTVYFRVNNTYKNVKICVYNGDDLIYSKKKLKVAPGEMESIVLKQACFENAKTLSFKLMEN